MNSSDIQTNLLLLFEVNCVDRHLDTLGDSTALIWEKDEPGTEEHVSYRYIHKSAIGGLIGKCLLYIYLK